MIKSCLLLWFLLKISIQCVVPSFKNNIIEVNFQNQTISGCISPDTIGFEGTISEIEVKNQDIQDLNYGAVQRISSKFRIDFVSTNIDIIRAGAFLDLPKVNVISFMSNELSWISENAFQDLPSLNLLYLNYNKIADVSPRAFNNLPNLQTVTFIGNNLENFDQSWFYKTPRLLSLRLEQNRLRNIPRSAFINLPSIGYLWINTNEIEFVDKEAFKGLRNLQLLDLSENKLRRFNFNFYTPSKLMDLSINNNNITYISDEMLDIIRTKLLVLEVTDNPLQCACLDKIIQWSDAFNISIPQRKLPESGVVCTVPKTKPSQCLERSDDDFHKGFWVSFPRERTR
ncbi:leucine-rich repeat-containing G-protein coupled receptor 6-like [Photinus pyralis]|uniref:leucine-rich repeat-containing G-protein coupled receptor 6-like n=1 Tax=Photinus pyralis TaxID=7054 RepID=UPI0012672CBF|nr:leucine-rich repeat-containing G-protein coupled receptor 6-like [Photinus pyralis]